jgi:hypothetical protein
LISASISKYSSFHHILSFFDPTISLVIFIAAFSLKDQQPWPALVAQTDLKDFGEPFLWNYLTMVFYFLKFCCLLSFASTGSPFACSIHHTDVQMFSRLSSH